MWFLAWTIINSPVTQIPLGVHNWNLYTMFVIVNGSGKPSLGATGHVIKMLQAKNGQKVDDLELLPLGKYQFWWKMICSFWAHYQPSFFWFCLFTPTRILFFFFFLTFFSVPSLAIYFLSSCSSFFIARFSVRVAGAVAQDWAATPHGLPSPPSFRLGEVPSDSIQDPQCNRSI